MDGIKVKRFRKNKKDAYMRKISFLSIFLCCGYGAGYAQTSDPGVLTFEQALEMTYANNRQMDVANYQLEIREKQKKAAASLRSPKFDLAANYIYMSKDIDLDMNGYKPTVGGLLEQSQLPIPPDIAAKLMGADWRYSIQNRSFAVIGATVTIPVFMGGKINVANRVADLEVQTAVRQESEQQAELFSQLAERYFGLSLALQVVQVRKDVLAGMKIHLADALKLEQNGVIPMVERLYVEMKVSEAESELEKAQADVRTILTALNNTLGRESGNVNPVSSMFVIANPGDVDYYKRLARENNAQLRQVALKERMAREAVKAERSAYMPEVVALGGIDIYNYQLTHFAPRWIVGAGLKFNIFDGLNREFRVGAARKQVKQVEAFSDKAASDIATLVEKTYNRMVSYASRIASYEATLRFNTEYLRIKSVAFKEGTVPSSDLVDASLELARTRIERLQNVYEFDVALAKLMEVCGMVPDFSGFAAMPGYRPVYYDAGATVGYNE